MRDLHTLTAAAVATAAALGSAVVAHRRERVTRDWVASLDTRTQDVETAAVHAHHRVDRFAGSVFAGWQVPTDDNADTLDEYDRRQIDAAFLENAELRARIAYLEDREHRVAGQQQVAIERAQQEAAEQAAGLAMRAVGDVLAEQLEPDSGTASPIGDELPELRHRLGSLARAIREGTDPRHWERHYDGTD